MTRSTRLESLCGDAVIAFESDAPLPADLLLPGETSAVARAVPKRVGEFAAGRVCARAALAALGINDFELLSAADRSPLWPAGIVGSISHTSGFYAAVAARQAEVLGLGLDAEARDSVGPHLWRRTCTRQETDHLQTLPEAGAIELATLIFSAKESFYKSQYPLTRQWLNFADIAIRFEHDSFVVEAQRPLDIAQRCPGPWRGRWLLTTQHALTAVRLDGPALAHQS